MRAVEIQAVMESNAQLNNVGLPTYSQLMQIIMECSSLFDNVPEANVMIGTRELVENAISQAFAVSSYAAMEEEGA